VSGRLFIIVATLALASLAARVERAWHESGGEVDLPRQAEDFAGAMSDSAHKTAWEPARIDQLSLPIRVNYMDLTGGLSVRARFLPARIDPATRGRRSALDDRGRKKLYGGVPLSHRPGP
jgi:hypothetical protein